MKGVRKICEIKKIPADTKTPRSVKEGDAGKSETKEWSWAWAQDSGSLGKVFVFFFFFLTHCPTPFFIGYKLIFHKLSLFCIWWQPISNLFFILSSLTNKLFLFLQSRRKRVSSSGSTSQPAMAKPSGQRPVILIRLTRNCGLEQELKLSFSDGISVGLRKNLVSNSYRCK